MTCLANELVILEERSWWAVRIPGNSTHHGVGIQNQTLFTLQTLGGFWTLTACTGLVTLYGAKYETYKLSQLSNSVQLLQINHQITSILQF